MGSKPPPPPDPFETAAAQAQANMSASQAASIMNNPNQFGPYGSQVWDKAGSEKIQVIGPDGNLVKQRVPRYNLTTTLSPEQQLLLDQQNSLGVLFNSLAGQQLGTAYDTLAEPASFEGLTERPGSLNLQELRNRYSPTQFRNFMQNAGPMQTSVNRVPISNQFQRSRQIQSRLGNAGEVTRGYAPEGGFSEDRKRVEEAIMSRVEPQFERDRKELETQLVNQGLTRGTEAFDDAMNEMRRQYVDSQMQAVLAGGQEQSRLLGEARAEAGFQNQAQQQVFDQLLTRGQFRNQAAAQDFAQKMQRAQFRNQADVDRFAQELQRATFMNDAQAQQFAQNMAQAQYKTQVQEMQANEKMRNVEYIENLIRYNNQLTTQEKQYLNDLRNLEMQELLTLRNQPINEIGAFMGTGQVTLPQFQSMFRQGIEPAPVAESVYRSHDIAAEQAAQQNQGLFGLLGAGLKFAGSLPMFSDERLKTDKKKVGETKTGTPIYTFKYKDGGPSLMGVMAQDIEKKQPKAVAKVNAGLLGLKVPGKDQDVRMVDYSKVH